MDSHGTIYAAAYQQGIWRSKNGGSTWEQVFATQDPTENTARTEFALNTTAGADTTRIYVGDGGTETDGAVPAALEHGRLPRRLDRHQDVGPADERHDQSRVRLAHRPSRAAPIRRTTTARPSAGTTTSSSHRSGTPTWSTSAAPSTTTCSATASTTAVRCCCRRTPATRGPTRRATTPHPTTGIHPDQHALAVDPANPLLFFEGSDGGVVRSSGKLTNASANCNPNLGPYSTTCTELLSAVPDSDHDAEPGPLDAPVPERGREPVRLDEPDGRDTGQRHVERHDQLALVAADDLRRRWAVRLRQRQLEHPVHELLLAVQRRELRERRPDRLGDRLGELLRRDGAPKEASAFYLPEIADPAVPGTQFTGLQHVWRTLDNGGDKATLEANCPEFTTFGGQAGCGDFAPLGDPSGNGGPGTSGDLTSSAVRQRPRRRLCRRSREDDRRPLDPVGGHGHRPRVRLAERQRRRWPRS